MKISIISGSHRKNSESERISNFINSICKSKLELSTHFLSLAENPIPLMDEGIFNSEDEKWNRIWKPVAKELQTSDGFVIVTPEWHGMVPSGLKNFLLLCSSKEVGHKPGLIVSVSASIGGAYPINELRISGYKNSRICFLPEHIIIRNCGTVLNKETAENESDEYIRSRIFYTLNLLVEYSKALKNVRESGKIDYKNYPNGM